MRARREPISKVQSKNFGRLSNKGLRVTRSLLVQGRQHKHRRPTSESMSPRFGTNEPKEIKAGPRKRIDKKITSDRRGRAVTVELVRPAGDLTTWARGMVAASPRSSRKTERLRAVSETKVLSEKKTAPRATASPLADQLVKAVRRWRRAARRMNPKPVSRGNPGANPIGRRGLDQRLRKATARGAVDEVKNPSRQGTRVVVIKGVPPSGLPPDPRSAAALEGQPAASQSKDQNQSVRMRVIGGRLRGRPLLSPDGSLGFDQRRTV